MAQTAYGPISNPRSVLVGLIKIFKYNYIQVYVERWARLGHLKVEILFVFSFFTEQQSPSGAGFL